MKLEDAHRIGASVARFEVHQVAAYLFVTRKYGGRDVFVSNGNERLLVEAADLRGFIELLQRLERENLQTNGHAR